MASTEEKLERLKEVFLKALDVSVNSIGEQDLEECFGDIKLKLGGNLQRVFVNMISKAERQMEEGFEELIEKHNIKQLLEETSAPTAASSATPETIHDGEMQRGPAISDDGMQDMLNKVKKAEIADLQNAIKTLEAEIKKSKDMGGRLRTQMINEVEALNEENLKIKNAAAIGMEQHS